MRLARRRLGVDLNAIPFQAADLGEYGVSRQRAEREVLWVTPTGACYGGADAVAKLLMYRRGAWAWIGAAMRVPVANLLARATYRLVAANRHRLSRAGGDSCAGPRETGRVD